MFTVLKNLFIDSALIFLYILKQGCQLVLALQYEKSYQEFLLKVMQCLKLTSLDLEQHLLFKYHILKQENIFGMYYFSMYVPQPKLSFSICLTVVKS